MSTSARRSTRLSAPRPSTISVSGTTAPLTLTSADSSSTSLDTSSSASTMPAKKKRTRKLSSPASALAEAATPSPSSITNQATAASPTTAQADGVKRCWNTTKPDSVHYHDTMWGNAAYFFPPSLSAADVQSPAYRESLRRLFMMQSLGLMQAGLSWSCIMGKWPAFERAFDEFDIDKVSQYDEKDLERLMSDPGIVRNKLKINAIIHNACTILQLQSTTPHAFLTLLFQHHLPHSHHRIHHDERILPTGRHQPSWMRTDYRTAGYKDRVVTDGVHPSVSVVELSRELKRAGFRFMGETVVLSWMQAVGLCNHHAHDCDHFQPCEEGYERVRAMFVKYAEEQQRQDEDAQQNGSEAPQAEEKTTQSGSNETERAKKSATRTAKRQTKAGVSTVADGGRTVTRTAPARGTKRRAVSAATEGGGAEVEVENKTQQLLDRETGSNQVRATRRRSQRH